MSDPERIDPATGGFPDGMSQPALQALEAAGILRLEQVADYTEAELLALHGVGPKSIRQLRPALAEKGLSFKPVAPPPSTRTARTSRAST